MLCHCLLSLDTIKRHLVIDPRCTKQTLCPTTTNTIVLWRALASITIHLLDMYVYWHHLIIDVVEIKDLVSIW